MIAQVIVCCDPLLLCIQVADCLFPLASVTALGLLGVNTNGAAPHATLEHTMARKTTDRTATKIRKCWAGRYEWVRCCDGAVIMEAEQGVLDHDPKAWQSHFTATASASTLGAPAIMKSRTRCGKEELVQGWAEGLIATNDEGWGPSRESRVLGCSSAARWAVWDLAGARHQLLRRIMQ